MGVMESLQRHSEYDFAHRTATVVELNVKPTQG